MNLAIELPEDIVQCLEAKWGDLSRHTLESLAVEGYRSGALTGAQVRRLLGFETRLQLDEFLKQAGVYLEYSEADLAQDRETHRRLQSQ